MCLWLLSGSFNDSMSVSVQAEVTALAQPIFEGCDVELELKVRPCTLIKQSFEPLHSLEQCTRLILSNAAACGMAQPEEATEQASISQQSPASPDCCLTFPSWPATLSSLIELNINSLT